MSKKTFKIVTYISYFFGVSLVVGMLYVFYYLGEIKAEERLPVHQGLLIYFICTICLIVSFFIWVNKTKLGKKYKKMYINWKDQKIENQAIEEIKGTEYYQYLPEYRGKNTFVPSGLFLEKIAIIIFSVMSFLPTIGFIYIAVRDNDLTVLIYIFFTLLIVPGVCLLSYLLSLKRKVTIDEDGVKLRRKKNGKIKTRFFSWDDVKVIALSVSPEGKRISWGYIYFTTKEIKKDRVIIEYFEKPYVIMLKYRPKVVHCVLKYWNKEIRNLEAMKNWKRYIDKIK